MYIELYNVHCSNSSNMNINNWGLFDVFFTRITFQNQPASSVQYTEFNLGISVRFLWISIIKNLSIVCCHIEYSIWTEERWDVAIFLVSTTIDCYSLLFHVQQCRIANTTTTSTTTHNIPFTDAMNCNPCSIYHSHRNSHQLPIFFELSKCRHESSWYWRRSTDKNGI